VFAPYPANIRVTDGEFPQQIIGSNIYGVPFEAGINTDILPIRLAPGGGWVARLVLE